MCRIQERVHNCGHYFTSFEPCEKAKKGEKICDERTTVVVSTGTRHCDLFECDQQASLHREGPG